MLGLWFTGAFGGLKLDACCCGIVFDSCFRLLILVILGFWFLLYALVHCWVFGSVDCYCCRLCVVFLCYVWVGCVNTGLRGAVFSVL